MMRRAISPRLAMRTRWNMGLVSVVESSDADGGGALSVGVSLV